MISSFLILAVHIVTRLFNRRVSTMVFFLSFRWLPCLPSKMLNFNAVVLSGSQTHLLLEDGNGRNCFKPTSYMSKDYACVTDSQSKHIYGRDNQNSARKGSKMAKNGKILAKMAL